MATTDLSGETTVDYAFDETATNRTSFTVPMIGSYIFTFEGGDIASVIFGNEGVWQIDIMACDG